MYKRQHQEEARRQADLARRAEDARRTAEEKSDVLAGQLQAVTSQLAEIRSNIGQPSKPPSSVGGLSASALKFQAERDAAIAAAAADRDAVAAAAAAQLAELAAQRDALQQMLTTRQLDREAAGQRQLPPQMPTAPLHSQRGTPRGAAGGGETLSQWYIGDGSQQGGFEQPPAEWSAPIAKAPTNVGSDAVTELILEQLRYVTDRLDKLAPVPPVQTFAPTMLAPAATVTQTGAAGSGDNPEKQNVNGHDNGDPSGCLLYTSPSPRD